MALIASTVRGEKHGGFYAQIHHKIVSGEWKPGERIPNRSELTHQFNTTLTTIQKTLHRLKCDGFVVPRGRIGTYVANILPGQHRFAIAFPTRHDHLHPWSRFWGAMEAVGQSITASGRSQVIIYQGLQDPDSPDMKQLVRDLAHSTLSGVLLVSVPPAALAAQTEFSRHPGRIFWLSGSPAPFADMVSIHSDSMVSRAIDHLQAQGRQRIALVNAAQRSSEPALFRQELSRRNLVFDPYRVVSAAPLESNLVRVAVYHMMKQSPEHRPDAIFVTDDHMAEAVGQAMIDARVRVPEDVTVAAHANFPYPPSSPIPLTLIGYDVAQLIEQVIRAAQTAPANAQPGPFSPIEMPTVLRTGARPEQSSLF